MKEVSTGKKTRTHWMKWWGWGDASLRFDLVERPKAFEYLSKKMGGEFSFEKMKTKAFDFSRADLPKSKIPAELIDQAKAALGSDGKVAVRTEDRLRHAGGKSYPDLIRVRSLQISNAPDLVFFPESEKDIEWIFGFCQKNSISLIPFGGGSSVVGGVEPNRGKHQYCAALNMTRMDRLIRLDEESRTVTFEAGVFGPELEAALEQRGFRLGHFPQSFEFSTLGGWIAARSSGQNSILYGGIEKMLVAARMLTPSGPIETPAVPRRSCGPELREIILGAEGVLGVITQATLRVVPIPVAQDYRMYLFKDFSSAGDAARKIVQSGLKTAMIRVSDESETEGMFAMARPSHGLIASLASKGIKFYLKKILGFPLPRASAVLVGFEGDLFEVQQQRLAVERILFAQGAFGLGASPGKSWLRDRFFLPYLRDDLLDFGLFVETMETATEWERAQSVYQAFSDAVATVCKKQNVPSMVYCHYSHLYPDGVSLYFTVVAGQVGRGEASTGDLIDQWSEIKRVVTEVVIKKGGAVSHHHGVGLDHRDFVFSTPPEKAAIKALKDAWDPKGILNPGKWA